MARTEIAFLGPTGTYSHLVATKYFGKDKKMIPLPTISDVCRYVNEKPSRRGIVPIENSSGGAIYETVDILLSGNPKIHTIEEVALNVQLALLGTKGKKIKQVCSHFAPLEHCSSWISKNLPGADKKVVSSTAVAAEYASTENNTAALGSRALASKYNLDILEFPVQADVVNMTMFLVIGGKGKPEPRSTKSLLSVHLPNTPGSLCDFLETFRAENVNLSKIISRPIRGCPREYAFLFEITGSPNTASFKRALKAAKKASVSLHLIGSFPCHKSYKS